MSNDQFKMKSIKLSVDKDKDLIDFLEGKPVSFIFKTALRYYMTHESNALDPKVNEPAEKQPKQQQVDQPIEQQVTQQVTTAAKKVDLSGFAAE